MPAPSATTRIIVFLASPGDVEEERALVQRIIDSFGKVFEEKYGIVPCLRRFENLPPGGGRPQSQINPLVDESHLFVGILYQRWGTKTRRYSSGFDEEFQRAFRRWKRTRAPDLCIFFRDPHGRGKDPIIADFKRKYQQELLWKSYNSPEEFAELFREFLLRKMLPSPPTADPSTPAGADSTFPEAGSSAGTTPAADLNPGAPPVSRAALASVSWTAQGLAKTELPSLAPWSRGFRSAYEDTDRDYTKYSKNMRDPAFVPASDEERIEQLINLCVEREPRRAMAALDALNQRGWPPVRRAVLHRLKGALFFELGNGRAASTEYRSAHRLAEGFPALRKALKFDLHRLSPLDWKEGFKRGERTRRLPGWLGTPAQDSALQGSADSFTKDLFFDVVRPEGAHRFSSGSSGSVGKYNLALAIAYLTGDLASVRDARESFARRMATSAKLKRDVRRAKVALEEATAAGAEDVIAEILGAFGSDLATHLGAAVDELVRPPPLDATGTPAEGLQVVRNELVRGLAPYISSAVRAGVVHEMAAATVDFLPGKPGKGNWVSLASRRGHRAPVYFVRAFRAVAGFEKVDLGSVLQSLVEAGEQPTDGSDFWEMALETDWAKVAPDVVDAVIRHVQDGLVGASDRELGLVILSQIRAEVPGRMRDLDRWLLSHPKNWLLRGNRWEILLRLRSDEAIEDIGQLLPAFVAQLVKEAKRAGDRDGISMSSTHRSDLLPLAARTYHDALSNQGWDELVAAVLEAAANPHLYAGHKASVFKNLAQTIKSVGFGDATQKALVGRTAAAEPARVIASMLAPSVALVSVRVRLIELRHTAGLPPSPEDLDHMLAGLQAPGPQDMGHAVWVASYLASEGFMRDALTGFVLQRLHDPSNEATAFALWSALTHNLFVGSPMQGIAFRRIAELAGSDRPYVARTALHWLGRESTIIPSDALDDVRRAIAAAASARHAGVAMEARKAQWRL
jgi:hypothetical protein